MKAFILYFASIFFLTSATENVVFGPSHMWGSWTTNIKIEGKTAKVVKIFTKNYFITATYRDAEFIAASGGTWTMSPRKIEETYEFSTNKPELIGTTVGYKWTDHEEMKTMFEGEMVTWNRIDDGTNGDDDVLFGAWRITGREQNGNMIQITLGPRKTFKVLSGTRFQWAAYNVATKQFYGTGGGTYTIKDGKYTENIDVFSRDNSRVGASLQFDYEVKGREWHHSGLSSRGNPIYEVWTNQDN